MLQTPPIAVEQTKREILRMAELSMENFDRSIEIIMSGNFFEREAFDRTETEINFINRALVSGGDSFSEDALYEFSQLRCLCTPFTLFTRFNRCHPLGFTV